MKSKDDNLIVVKSKAFALRCIKLYRHVNEEQHVYDLTRQFLKSGTSWKKPFVDKVMLISELKWT